MKKALASLGRVLHAFQKERGSIILFLSSKGEFYSNRVYQRFLDTDYAIEELMSNSPTWEENNIIDSDKSDKLNLLFENINNITKKRQLVLDQEINVTEVVGIYSHNIIGPVIDIMVDIALNHPNTVSSHVSAYANFLHLKERIGRERALGARGLVLNAFKNPEFIENYRFLISEQESYHNTFLSLATDIQKKSYKRHMDDYAVLKLEDMHKELTSKDSQDVYDISPVEWYDLTTQKIDLMHQVELDLINTLSSDDENEMDEEPLKKTGSSFVEQQYKNFIRTLPLFRGVKENILDELLKSATIKSYNKGNLLFLQGEQPNRLYIILNGWVKIYKANASGDETILQMLTSGDMVLESAVFLNAPYPLNAQVTNKSTILSFPAPIIRERVKSDNGLALNVLNGMSLHSQILIRDIENIRLKSAVERVGWFFLRLLINQGKLTDKIELPYDKSLIAAYLDMKPETFSRTLQKYKQKGFDIKKDAVIMPSVNALCGFCDVEVGSVCTRHGTSDCPNPDCDQNGLENC